MEHQPIKHHRKCPAYKNLGTHCECNNIHTPPTEPRYQKQRRLQWEKKWADKLKQKNK
jgi:hypothetical protein